MKVHKKKFIKSPTGIIPFNGYSGDKHSKESLEWLAVIQKQWLAEGKQINIQHARCSQGKKVIIYQGKFKPIRYKVDGYFEYNGKKYICEYNGCNWHGCPGCYTIDRENTMIDKKSLAQRYRETLLKEKRLREMGYNVITKWSCEFLTDLIRSEDLKKFVKSLNIQEPINLRDCYFGGRTNALVLHKKFTNG